MKVNIVIAFFSFWVLSSCVGEPTIIKDKEPKGTSFLELSYSFLEHLRDGESTAAEKEVLAFTTIEALEAELSSDIDRYVFWVNIYNAFILDILNEKPELYEDRRSFFKQPYINIAGLQLSFADIEHGIIRRSQREYFLGFVGKLFPPKYQRQLRPSKRDYRVHFALNCGAQSCPPITILRADIYDSQIEKMTKDFLEQTTTYDKSNNKVVTTPLCSWFRGDFGGKKGVRKMLYTYGLTPDTKVDLEFGDYDWTLLLNNFAS